jgi:hypothetical protein
MSTVRVWVGFTFPAAQPSRFNPYLSVTLGILGGPGHFRQFLLVAEAVLIATIRALPGDIVAGHAPQIFMHAPLADAETAAAAPAEAKCPVAAMAEMLLYMSPPPGGFAG